MAGASVQCVVWEWQRDDGGFSPYPPDMSCQIETAYFNGAGNYTMVDYTVHFSRMVQKKHNTGYERPIHRTLVKLPASPDIKAYWTWNEYGRHYVLYLTEASVDIELAYQRGDTSVNLATCSSQLPYTVDLTAMEQTRHGYGTRRSVQRQPLTAGSMQSHLQIRSNAIPLGSALVATSLRSLSSLGGVPNFAVSTSLPASSTTKSSPATRRRKVCRGKVKKSAGTASSSSGVVVEKVEAATPPDTSPRRDDSEIGPFARKVKTLKPTDDGPCPICMSQLSEHSGFDEEEPPIPVCAPPADVYKLSNCEHMMHRACLLVYMKNSAKSGFQCPTCKKVYGVKTGDMPDGTMTVKTQNYSLPGHEGYGTFEITYNFSPGVHNGRRYRTNGFPRICYLPDSPKGRKVLKLLKVAWERKLTFTIGTSVTTGAMDTLVWNEIHHKTESTSNHSGHGYPDPKYLDNVLMELAAQGVEDNSDKEVISVSSDSDSDL